MIYVGADNRHNFLAPHKIINNLTLNNSGHLALVDKSWQELQVNLCLRGNRAHYCATKAFSSLAYNLIKQQGKTDSPRIAAVLDWTQLLNTIISSSSS